MLLHMLSIFVVISEAYSKRMTTSMLGRLLKATNFFRKQVPFINV